KLSSSQQVLDLIVDFCEKELQVDLVIGAIELPDLNKLETKKRWVIARTPLEKFDNRSADSCENVSKDVPREYQERFRLLSLASYDQQSSSFSPVVINNSSSVGPYQDLNRSLKRDGIKSFIALPIYLYNKFCGWLEVHSTSRYVRWRRDQLELLEDLSESCRSYLEKILSQSTSPQSTSSSERLEKLGGSSALIEHGDLVFLRINRELTVQSIQGDTQRLFGVPAQDLLSDRNIWSKFVHLEDLLKLARQLRVRDSLQTHISEDVRIIHQSSGERRSFSVKAIPLYSEPHEFCGWEILGFDITNKVGAERELLSQSKRIEALYEVSRALQFNLDPAIVALRGLKAIIKATNSDAGFGCFYERGSGELELVAAQGLSSEYVAQAPQILNGKSLLRYTVEEKRGLIIGNIQRDTRAAQQLARSEGLRATILMPLIFEDQVLGAIGLFCRRANRYSQADFELVAAASRQIALAAQQAESYAAEKRQASSLAALYKLTHELSRFLTPREIVEHAFPIIKEEFSCKRIWLGVLNEQGTHLVGQGGSGPGVRGRLLNIQIELNLRHDAIDQAIRTRQPVVVRRGEKLECSGLNKIVQQLQLETIVIVPLVSLGQVVGLLVIEPSLAAAFFAQRKLPLLASMASEIASVLLARRFEAQMADADKMRMAALLASGVAHNFDNLLQAVMGQASLIEMQSPEKSPAREAAETIIESAAKGAALIKQLLSFTQQGVSDKR
ncbi:MAG: GAF domain-containing protein, partial [Bdellovibrionales bacterium]|nr:GAF domain-containing protein [Bdellovibrionales bacterium]